MTIQLEIRGLTLWRPWPWAILHGSKRIENRPWACPQHAVGQLIALHAGKRWHDDGAESIAAMHPEMPRGSDDHAVGIVGVARVVGCITDSDDRWFFGPYGWLLDQVAAIDVIPMRGAQGLWPISPGMAAVVLERYREALAKRGAR